MRACRLWIRSYTIARAWVLLQVLPRHERTKVEEPMDTIFVKQVRENSPAAEAGLRTGDRVVSVNGTPTRGEQYASVVQRIQQAGPQLKLLVISKEHDILQRVRNTRVFALFTQRLSFREDSTIRETAA